MTTDTEERLDVCEWKGMVLAMLASARASPALFNWATQCMLHAFEEGAADDSVIQELLAEERRLIASRHPRVVHTVADWEDAVASGEAVRPSEEIKALFNEFCEQQYRAAQR